jgi:hypothetical protein
VDPRQTGLMINQGETGPDPLTEHNKDSNYTLWGEVWVMYTHEGGNHLLVYLPGVFKFLFPKKTMTPTIQQSMNHQVT